MSATDSESSIDWLATDNEEDEENERENEPDCVTRRPGQPCRSSLSPGRSPTRRGPPESDSSSSSSSSSSSGGGGVLHHGRRGDPVKRACSSLWSAVGDGEARRLFQAQAGGEARSVRNPLKRPHGSTEGQEPQPLSNQEDRGQQVFTSKCMALQCYIHPLSSILNGLRSGRYRERLSSFQESVAIDRIQRIMGVLQNPCMGEKYVNIILKMEEMLKSWFPNIKPQDQRTVAQTEHESPTKKLKLSSPVTTDLTSASSLASPGATGAPKAQGPTALRVTDHSPPGAYSASSSLKWLHTSPICSPSAGLPPPPPPPPQQQPQAQASPRHPPPAPRDKELTQDSAVSSSTDRHAKTDAAALLKAPPLGKKINAPCLERLLKSTESIISRKASGRVVGNS